MAVSALAGDVSRAKIEELLDRLLRLTEAGRGKWERQPDGNHKWALPSGMIDVGPQTVTLWDDRGTCLRRFTPPKDALWLACEDMHERMAGETLDAIIAHLESL